jgi:putative FmdB family regulatory protein
MVDATVETFRCMMCGHEYQERVEKGEDKERSCPKCRSNSIRHLKRRAAAATAGAGGEAGG